MSICQRDRWLAMIARSDDEVVLAPLGEAAHADAQVELICDTVLHAFSAGEPAAISGFNVPSAALEQALTEQRRQGPPRRRVSAGPPRPVARSGRGAVGRRHGWTNRRWRSSR